MPVKPIVINAASLTDFKEKIAGEPTIRTVQEAAVSYANVAPEKTKRWHRNARLRALVPSLNFDIDSSSANNIDIDRGSTSTEDIYIVGPDDKAFTWDFTLEWELADLIWNDDATAIDYREKYTVEMREDIVSEVTTLYFERRRKQLELFMYEEKDSHEYLELCMAVDELTARIDGLTGGGVDWNINKK
jgi:hypothetical protein